MRLVLLIVLFFTSVTCVHTFLVQATNVKIELLLSAKTFHTK